MRKAADLEKQVCATRLNPDVRKAFRSERAVNDALRLVIELRKVGSYKPERFQFERRLRSYDPEVATLNSSLELTVGSSSKEKPTVTRALTVATRRFKTYPL